MGMLDKIKDKIQPPTVPVSSMGAPPQPPVAPMGPPQGEQQPQPPAPPQMPPMPQQGPPPVPSQTSPSQPRSRQAPSPPPMPPQRQKRPQPQPAPQYEEDEDYPKDYPEEYYEGEEPGGPVVSAPEPRGRESFRDRYEKHGTERGLKVINERGVFSKNAEEAPVFIKLTRYEEVLSEITNIRQIITNLNGIISIYEMIREIESEMISEWSMNVKRLESAEDELDKILTQMEPLKKRIKESKFKEISPDKSDTIKDLESRISRLKDEISKMG